MTITRFLETRPRIDQALSALDKGRLRLPVISLAKYFPDFAKEPVSFYEVPVGPWSSPLADVTMLLKVIVSAESRRAMEVGSYRGYTALAIARHMPENGSLVTLDAYPDHGEAYLNTEHAAKIERRVGLLTPDLLNGDPLESYDLIFLDAGHRYAEVKHDTELLLPLLSPNGYFLWHDYSNWGRFNKLNGVPEYLHELSEGSGLPIARISGSGVAIHCPVWASSKRAAYLAALESPNQASAGDPWSVSSARG